MKTGIVGLSSVGKTTIFKILTRASEEVVRQRGRHGQPNVGVVKVPDARVDFLASIFHPRKTTYATVEFVDVGGLAGGRGADVVLDPVRQVDAIVHVVRAFKDAQVPHPAGSIDPQRDIRDFDAELILADLASVERRLERLDKDLQKIKDADLELERKVLQEAREWLESERPLREMPMTPADAKRIRGFRFFSEKPMIHAINVGEDDLGLLRQAEKESDLSDNTVTVYICGKLEAEMAELPNEELQSFLDDYGIQESGMVRLIRSAYRLLGLISFLTAGEEECRAWTIRRGTRAQVAAGAIHSDLESHFIRAEVCRFEDFKQYPSFAALREQGLLRLEGREYEVQDGDIITVRHSG